MPAREATPGHSGASPAGGGGGAAGRGADGRAAGGSGEGGPKVSALPSVQARVLAFLVILVAGVCGGLIGGSFVHLQCQGDCTTPVGLGGLVGAAIAAGGVAVVAVLTLRAMGEWRTIKEDREREAERRLAAIGLGPEVREPAAGALVVAESDFAGAEAEAAAAAAAAAEGALPAPDGGDDGEEQDRSLG